MFLYVIVYSGWLDSVHTNAKHPRQGIPALFLSTLYVSEAHSRARARRHDSKRFVPCAPLSGAIYILSGLVHPLDRQLCWWYMY